MVELQRDLQWDVTVVCYLRSGRFVCHLFFSHSVCGITAKVMSRFHWNLVIWLDLTSRRICKLLVVIRSRIRIPDHFSISLTIAEYGILGDLLAFLIQSPPDFHDTRRNYWRRQDNESTTFWQRSGRHPERYATDVTLYTSMHLPKTAHRHSGVSARSVNCGTPPCYHSNTVTHGLPRKVGLRISLLH